MEKNGKKIFNPFEGRNADEVWREIQNNMVPITREEAIRKMIADAEKEKKNREAGK